MQLWMCAARCSDPRGLPRLGPRSQQDAAEKALAAERAQATTGADAAAPAMEKQLRAALMGLMASFGPTVPVDLSADAEPAAPEGK